MYGSSLYRIGPELVRTDNNISKPKDLALSATAESYSTALDDEAF